MIFLFERELITEDEDEVLFLNKWLTFFTIISCPTRVTITRVVRLTVHTLCIVLALVFDTIVCN